MSTVLGRNPPFDFCRLRIPDLPIGSISVHECAIRHIYYLTRWAHAVRFCGVQEKCHLWRFSSALNICFQRAYPLNILPPEARQSFTHHVDHRLGGPTVATIVKEGEV